MTRNLNDLEELQLVVVSLNRLTQEQGKSIEVLSLLVKLLGERIDVCDREIDKIKEEDILR